MYTRDTVVAVSPFTRQPDGAEIIIGRIETGVFLAIPPQGVEVLEHLAEGKSVGEVADLYCQKYGETPDLDEFLSLLEVKGIVEPVSEDVNGRTPARSTPKPRPVRHHFAGFPQSLARRIFSLPVLAFCGLVIALAITAIIRDHSLAPSQRDLYFPHHRTLLWTFLLVGSYGSVLAHEVAHVIATRALGLNARLGLGNRLWDLVMEADLTALWSVPKRQRYLPLFAGSLLDAFSGSVLVFVLVAQGHGWLSLPDSCVRLTRALIFTYTTRLLFQWFFFVRTDYYYVIASLFNCRSLLSDTEDYLRNHVARILPRIRRVDQSAIPALERRVIRVYAWVWVAGRILAFAVLFSITLPLALRYTRNLGAALNAGYSANPSDFVDAFLFASYFVVPVSIGMTIWIRSLIHKQRT